MKNSKLKHALKSINVKKHESVQKLTAEEIKVIKGGYRLQDSFCGINSCNGYSS